MLNISDTNMKVILIQVMSTDIDVNFFSVVITTLAKEL